jgi:PleD family two-component response regulator
MADATRRFALVNPALAEAPEHGSVTIGLAELQAVDTTFDLLGRADAALYRSRSEPPATR